MGSDHPGATRPYATGAPLYAEAGWTGVFPVVRSTKLPALKNVTGRDGIQSQPGQYDAPHMLAAHGACNLGVRLPRGVVGIDVDDYDGKTGAATLAKLEAELGALPPTFTSTARGDGPSRIRFYRVPEDCGELAVSAGADIDVIQHHHRYAVVWPSVHPKTGTAYRWYRTDGEALPEGLIVPQDGFPDLPAAWLEHLSKPQHDHAPGAGLGVEEFTALYGGESDPELVDRIREKFSAQEGSRHDTMLQALGWAARSAVEGKVAAAGVFGLLEDDWHEATGGGREEEFQALVERAVADAPEPPAEAVSEPETAAEAVSVGLIDGLSFLAPDEPDEPPLWGHEDVAALWSSGESLFIVGPPGAGKSTLAHLVVFGRLGLLPEVFGFPVADDGRKVLYLAMDRPKQIQRAMRRLFRPEHGEVLAERLLFHRGPLPVSLTSSDEHRDYLRDMALREGAGVIVVDSIKDVLPDASDEKAAGRYNSARQSALAAGVEWIELHHNRKANGTNKAPNTLEDVYGSRWLTAGAGSVLSLWQDEPGSPVISLSHLRASGEKWRDTTLILDTEAGTLATETVETLEDFARRNPKGFTVGEATAALHPKSSKGKTEGVRLKIKRLVDRKVLELCPVADSDPLDTKSATLRYRLKESG
ncbi:bifunctional DNA primase/polymerase [Streptomyces sp. NPDC048188]|uniref:bifunctional DNA primase/polymerase n=1 Tax=Streptomyces sp. NPDC048188 TaxID=3155749 RepID=UPI0034316382